MKIVTFLFLSGIMLIISSCNREEVADLVIINGKVFTVDPSIPYAEAVAIKGEFITEVGKNSKILKLVGEKTSVIDAKGRLVIPGFNDAHIHFGPLDPDYIELRYTTDPATITEKVAAMVAKSKPGQVIRGGHWDHEMFTTREWPTKELIDRVSPDNPVILSRADGHSVLVNSYVLKKSGITKNTPDPPGGEIQRDPVTGEPTGILKDNAENLIRLGDVSVSLTPEEQKAKTWEGYLLALKEAREYGVTSIQIPGSADFEVYEKLKEQGLLTSRIDIGQALTGDTNRLKRYLELAKKYPRDSNWIRFGYLKVFVDGSMGSGTALMFEPFNDRPETSGLAMHPYEEFEDMVLKADRMGFQIGAHAIGDKANFWALNAFEKAMQVNGRRDSRHRIEHAQTLQQSDIPRFGQLGVIASMQPTHCITDKNFYEKRVGYERSKGAYVWRSLLDAGAILAFGTDYQVEPINPMEGLYAAVTRKDRRGEEGEGWFPEQKLTMEEAIKYYTWGSAYAQFMDDRKGIIKRGYLADIVITDKDLLTIPENEIMKTKVDYTIVGGKVVYSRNEE
ncbi:MAG TPA: amidohydrolase [Bacteroidales bacterium]|nr:amidohydrolase [Bacteroidales bacterium]HOK74581.1 amidohydrolase [Bacteroidales bacterium]HOM40961.1 amidohydrolase [Bacteroidales bacterium]HPP93194.1 amidohydrolase [Bacteroidales bacterium]HQK71594.1 amidohydrolase [Bacteroidales bacterium]